MPSIEQYDWSKLRPETPEVKHISSPQPKKQRKKKSKQRPAKDYSIFHEAYDKAAHLREIMREV